MTRGYLAGQNNRKKNKGRGVQVTGQRRMREDKNKQGCVGHEGLCCHGCQGLAALPQLHDNQNDKMESVLILYKAKMCSGRATFGLKLKKGLALT